MTFIYKGNKSKKSCDFLFVIKESVRERERKRETIWKRVNMIIKVYSRTPKWTFAVGACGTPPRRRSRRLLWRSPLAWNTCAATGCDALRSIIGFVYGLVQGSFAWIVFKFAQLTF